MTAAIVPELHTGPYARPPRCPHHGRRVPGCTGCRRYQRWTTRRHRLSRSQGQPLTVPVADVRDHLRRLQGAGMLLREISEAARVSQGTLSGILYKPNTRFVCRDNAHRILALPVPDTKATPRGAHLVPAVGTIRRVRALVRIGWTFGDIIAAGGSAIHRLDQVKDQEWVTERFAAAVKKAYEALSMTPGRSTATAARGARKGWAPPLAWDDDTIDDPTAQPDLGDPDADVIDEIAVRRALAGEPVRLTAAEREHAFRVGFARGMTAYAIGRALNVNSATYKAIVRRVTTDQAA